MIGPASTDHHTSRAGNGTRTRDPNLGKVVLYQLSYSREQTTVLVSPRSHGGEGNRTPDLLNAIQALSQLSYAPGIPVRTRDPEPKHTFPQEPPYIAAGIYDVKKSGLAESHSAGNLHRPGTTCSRLQQNWPNVRVFHCAARTDHH